MEWGLVKKRVLEAVRHLADGDARKRQWADALDQCFALAEEVHRTREVDAELRGQLDRAERAAAAMRQALQEIEAGYCQCDVRAGLVCVLHAIVRVRRALERGSRSLGAGPGTCNRLC